MRILTLGQISASLEEDAFHGRNRELALFRSWLADEAAPASLLTVTGPGGIGKSALLRAFARMAQQLGRTVRMVDGRTVTATPRGLRAAIVGDQDRGLEHLHEVGPLVLIDSFEQLLDLGQYLYTVLLPSFSTRVKVVLAGRALPSSWSSSGVWHRLTVPLRLSGFSPEESREYLAKLGVHDPDRVKQALEVADGHPLALSMAADLLLRLGVHDLGAAQEWRLTLHALVRDVLREVPDPQLRALVDAGAVVRELDEGMLLALLGGADSETGVDQLLGLSIFTSSEHGLMLHPAIRRLLASDLRWGRPATYRTLRTRALAHIQQRLASAEAAEAGALVQAHLDLAANEAIRALLFTDDQYESPTIERARAAELPELVRFWSRYGPSARSALSSPGTESHAPRGPLEALLGHAQARSRVARNRDGELVGSSIVVPLSDELVAGLSQHPTFAALAQTKLPRAEQDVWLVGWARAEWEAGDAVESALLRDCLTAFVRGGTYLCCTAARSQQRALEILGFERIADRDAPSAETRGAAVFGLKVPRGELATWLSRLTTAEAQPESLAQADPLLRLTEREREVLSLLTHGAVTNRQIAAQLFITEGTANLHVKRILNKLGVASRAQAVAWATQNGLNDLGAAPPSATRGD